MSYRAPVRDLAFTLEAIAGVADVAATGAFPDYDADVAGAVLAAAGQFSEEVLALLNRIGDQKGATYANGSVTAAPGFADAYRQFAVGGWTGLSASAEAGGQALPKALELAAYETVHAANMAFGLCPMLSLAAIEALEQVGTEDQKARYLTRLVSGEWTGAMVLTEPGAGSDLGSLTATAAPNGDGTYALNGQKIFITWGDHDATDNIVHLVLARLPDAPKGPKGISLFLASKFAVKDDGTLSDRNAFRPVGVEHKLGIHASPTCVMSYEGARAELVGRPNEGLAHMFVMMNAARLAVGVEGVGVAERAYQHALAYALERRQGRSVWTGEQGASHLRPPRRAPHAGRHEDQDLGRARHLPVDRRRRRPGAPRRDRGGASPPEGPRGPVHPHRQGLVHRCRLRGRLPGRPGPQRHGLHRGDRRGPILSRRPHRPDLRRHQRHPGHGPGGSQTVDGRRGLGQGPDRRPLRRP